MNQNVDHHSFLVSSKLFTDEMKDNIALAGYCIIEGVKEASTTIDFNKNSVTYHLLLPDDLCKNLRLLEKFEKGEDIGFWNSMSLRRFLKKKRDIDVADDSGIVGYKLEQIANKFLKAYLNNEWSASVEIFNADNDDESKNFRIREAGDRKIN